MKLWLAQKCSLFVLPQYSMAGSKDLRKQSFEMQEPLYRLQMKKRTALLRRLKVILRGLRTQPITRVIEAINLVLRGWVNYFAVGNASRCFSFIRNWVEQKIRRHLAKSRQRRGFGWKRWSRRWLYETLGLFDDYRVRPRSKVGPTR